eukprot:TRINITY_DN1088_c0_g1_i1.p1 TRINITY_DN1088_c0_g1~~TRINITY_DN1088_c0_g1_i1.p1  ORF type:complete len:859 (-),score=216.46 TRINITY_DN1088_c0_g1_i1:1384-3960(-)
MSNSSSSASTSTATAESSKSDKWAKVQEIYQNKLEYGPALEEDSVVKAWVAEHKGKFGHFIGNKWVHPENRKYSKSICPANKSVIAETIEGTADDVNMAVKTARAAYEKWSKLKPSERAKHIYAVARHVQKHQRLFMVLEALDNGKPFRETKFCDVPIVVRHIYHHVGWAQLMQEEMPNWKSLGVIGEILPWNFPLMLLVWKLCPALAMGNTVVMKPASYTRLSALLLAEVCAEAGLPAGVFNVITGPGRMGSDLVDHTDIDKVAFTGSTEIGRMLRQRIAGSGKKISLELGGKSPMIVFDNADLDSAVEGCVDGMFFNQGQVCCAASRLLLQESIVDVFLIKLKRRLNTFRLGHPLEKNIDMGALVDESQFKTITKFCEGAVKENCEVWKAKVDIPTTGWYWPPTIITNCYPSNTCVREEIFGPVLAVMSFRTPEEAVQLANNTKFGLAGSVWTENISLALECAVSIRAGTIWINAHNLFDGASGFGGYRQSGFGRDGGKEGLYEYVKPKWMGDVKSKKLTFPVEEKQIVWPKSSPLTIPAPSSESKTNSNASSSSSSSSSCSSEKKESCIMSVDRTPKLHIGGKQCRPDGEYTRAILTPEGDLISNVAEGSRKDIRNAVEAARNSQHGWGKRAAHDRAQICYYIAENLTARSKEFATRIVQQTGCSMEDAEKEVAASVDRLFFYAAYADKFGGVIQETTLYGVTARIHEPVGVIGIACPDEFSLLGFVSLLAPALVRGNSVVIVPSEKHPLSATDLYQVFDTSDVPAGVINIVTGERDTLTKTLAEHFDVDSMWYFGSEEGSRNVEYVAGDSMKRTFVNYGCKRDWLNDEEGQGLEFLLKAIEVKNIWIPMGEMKS